MGLGVALLQGFGSYNFQVNDPQQFVTQIVGAQGVYRTADIENRLRTMLLSKLQDLLGETTAKSSVVELIGMTEEIGAGVRAKGQDDFSAIGLTLKSFYIANLKPYEKSAEELRAMGMLDMQTYTQLQAADALRDAAQNPAGGAGLTAGIGAGMGIGNVIAQSLQNVGQPGQPGQAGQTTPPQGQTRPGGAPQTSGAPDIMTPAEAANVLRVTEQDVLDAIQAGDLKARKIGSTYRISREALDAFLKS
jgi:excisionase family DNA binding protein